MRSAVSAGAKVFVLGCEQASILRYSRYCERYTLLAHPAINEARPDPEVMLRLIEERIAADKIDLVMGSDGKSTRTVIALASRLSATVLPSPSLELFDLLDDKWAFHHLCNELGLRTPLTWVFETKQDLLDAAASGSLPQRSITKPLRSFGERGQFRFDPRHAAEQLVQVDYYPIMVQEVIDGIDHALSLYAHEGKVTGCANHYKNGPQWIFENQKTFYSYARAIVGHLKITGIYNFDARITSDGKVYMFECNPRTYLSADYDMMMGFSALGDALKKWDVYPGERALPEGLLREILGTLKVSLTPWKIQRQDLSFVLFCLKDPIPYALDFMRLVVLRMPPSIVARLTEWKLIRLLLG